MGATANIFTKYSNLKMSIKDKSNSTYYLQFWGPTKYK